MAGLINSSGSYFLTSKENIRKLIDKFNTPLLVVSEYKLLENYNKFREELPQVKIFYAAKANSHKDILRILMEAGSGFDVSSSTEYQILSDLGVDNSRILYTHPITSKDEFEFFNKHGVNRFIVDNEAEIRKTAQYIPGSEIILRLVVDNPGARINLSYKFGMPQSAVEQNARLARKLGLDVVGLAFHVGSQTTTPYPYINALNDTKRMTNILLSEGYDIRILDIGGGFPIPYPEWAPPFEVFAKPIREMLEEYFFNVEVIAEPGRFIVADTTHLVTSIIGKSKRNNVNWYYIDDSLYHSFSGKVYDHADYPIIHFKEKESAQLSVIAGRTCDSSDVIYKSCMLPELNIGDILVFSNMGAYTLASSSEFNGFKPAKLIIYEEVS